MPGIKPVSSPIIVITGLLMILQLAACGGGGGGSGGSQPQSYPTVQELESSVQQMTQLTGAQGLVFTNSNPPTQLQAVSTSTQQVSVAAQLTTSLQANTMYKVNTDGTLEQVIVTDANNQEANRGLVRPVAVADVSTNFMVLYFLILDKNPNTVAAYSSAPGLPYTWSGLSLAAYLVHKPTGFAYSLNGVSPEVVGAVSCDIQNPDTGTTQNYTIGLGAPFPAVQIPVKSTTIPDLQISCQTSPVSGGRVIADDQENIFFQVLTKSGGGNSVNDESYIFKVDTSNLGGSSINATQLHTTFPVVTDYTYFSGGIPKDYFDVDGTGSYIIYNSLPPGTAYDTNSVTTYVLDVATGQFTDLAIQLAAQFPGYNQIDPLSTMKDINGDLYIIGRSNSGSHLFKVLSAQPGSVTFKDMGSVPSGTGYVGYKQRIIVGGKVLYVELPNAARQVSGGQFFELDPVRGLIAHNTPASQFVNGLWDFFTYSNGYFYYFGKEVNSATKTIYRYDPVTQTGVLFPTGTNSPFVQANLQVSDIKVIDDTQVWFKATRTTDSATVYGTADMNAGTINITGTTAAAEPLVFVMQAISSTDFVSIDGSYLDWATSLRVASDPSGDASAGNDLTYLSVQQSATQFYGLVEFDKNDILLNNASTTFSTTLTVDGMYDIVIKSDGSYIVDLSNNSQTPFADIGGISAIGQAVEFRVPLSSLGGIGTAPTYSVTRVSLHAVTVQDSYTAPSHTVSVTLPRALASGETVNVKLVGSYELNITSTAATLVDTSVPTSTDVSASSSGLGSTAVSVVISDSAIGSTGAVLSPTTTTQLPTVEDQM